MVGTEIEKSYRLNSLKSTIPHSLPLSFLQLAFTFFFSFYPLFLWANVMYVHENKMNPNHEPWRSREKAIRVFKCSFALSIHLLVVLQFSFYIFLCFVLSFLIHGGRKWVEEKWKVGVCVCAENWTVSLFCVPTVVLERAENYNCWDSCRSM